MLKETFTLNNGVKIPKLGLGTWFIEGDNGGRCRKRSGKIMDIVLIDTGTGIWKYFQKLQIQSI